MAFLYNFTPVAQQLNTYQNEYRHVLGFKPVYTVQMNLVRHLWITMHEEGIVKSGTDSTIDTYCRRICGTALRDAGPAQVQKVVETLKKWIARIEDKTAQDRLKQILTMGKPATTVVQ